jgi:hypothetical protein
MSDDYQRIEVITGAARRRRWEVWWHCCTTRPAFAMVHCKREIRAQHRGSKRRFREMPMRRRPTPQQLELFASPSDADLVPTPHWQTLPEEVRVTLTGLMVRLILDHTTDARAPHLTETRREA